MDLSQYNLWLFDCDGVILDSNKIKSQVMYQVALHFANDDIATQFQRYHQENAGITRFVKFEYLFTQLLKMPITEQGNAVDCPNSFKQCYQQALTLFGELVVEQLIASPETAGILDFLASLPTAQQKYIVSAGTETELNHVFQQKNLNHYFDGIYGGPRAKAEIFADIFKQHPQAKPLYFGDAKADHIVAEQFGVDFVFVSDYSEFHQWQSYFKTVIKQSHKVKLINNFIALF